MKSLRNLLGILTLVLLGLGYVASQFAALNGTASDYAKRVDQPPIILLALVILIAMIAFMFIPDRTQDEESS